MVCCGRRSVGVDRAHCCRRRSMRFDAKLPNARYRRAGVVPLKGRASVGLGRGGRPGVLLAAPRDPLRVAQGNDRVLSLRW
jgi:hypothetical protein